MGLSSETRFDFEYMVRPWEFGLYVRESVANAGMRDSFGIMQLSGKPGEKPGEKRKHFKASMRELEAWRQWDGLFSFCQPGSHDGGRGLTWGSNMAHRWI